MTKLRKVDNLLQMRIEEERKQYIETTQSLNLKNRERIRKSHEIFKKKQNEYVSFMKKNLEVYRSNIRTRLYTIDRSESILSKNTWISLRKTTERFTTLAR